MSVGTTIILALTSGRDSATRQITERNRIIHTRVERVAFSTVESDILLYLEVVSIKYYSIFGNSLSYNTKIGQ
jgi:hypothetical protein